MVWTLKKKYPQIKSVLILAGLGRAVSTEHYDRTMYPEIEGGPMRFAISRRNRRLVDNSDVLIAYVILDSGGAAATRRYALRKNKRVITMEGGIKMPTGYEEVREELRGWDIEDLIFGLDWELSLSEKENFDEGLVSVYLETIEEKLPPMTFGRVRSGARRWCELLWTGSGGGGRGL